MYLWKNICKHVYLKNKTLKDNIFTSFSFKDISLDDISFKDISLKIYLLRMHLCVVTTAKPRPQPIRCVGITTFFEGSYSEN